MPWNNLQPVGEGELVDDIHSSFTSQFYTISQRARVDFSSIFPQGNQLNTTHSYQLLFLPLSFPNTLPLFSGSLHKISAMCKPFLRPYIFGAVSIRKSTQANTVIHLIQQAVSSQRENAHFLYLHIPSSKNQTWHGLSAQILIELIEQNL